MSYVIFTRNIFTLVLSNQKSRPNDLDLVEGLPIRLEDVVQCDEVI